MVEFEIEIRFFKNETVVRPIMAETPYIAIEKAMHGLELKERYTIKGIQILSFG